MRHALHNPSRTGHVGEHCEQAVTEAGTRMEAALLEAIRTDDNFQIACKFNCDTIDYDGCKSFAGRANRRKGKVHF